MSDLEISRALAIAIGWEPEQMRVFDDDMLCVIRRSGSLREFDYRDWNVIGPIAEKYSAFPQQYPYTPGRIGMWQAHAIVNGVYATKLAYTPQKAIALAVIEGAKK